MEIVTIMRDGMSVDLVLFRRYGTEGQSLLAETLELNPGLADLGYDAAGTTSVRLPECALRCRNALR